MRRAANNQFIVTVATFQWQQGKDQERATFRRDAAARSSKLDFTGEISVFDQHRSQAGNQAIPPSVSLSDDRMYLECMSGHAFLLQVVWDQ